MRYGGFRGRSGWVAPLTDRDLATARGRSIEGMYERGGTGEEGAAKAERVRCEIIRTS